MPQNPRVIGRTTAGDGTSFFQAESRFALVIFGAGGNLARR